MILHDLTSDCNVWFNKTTPLAFATIYVTFKRTHNVNVTKGLNVAIDVLPFFRLRYTPYVLKDQITVTLQLHYMFLLHLAFWLIINKKKNTSFFIILFNRAFLLYWRALLQKESALTPIQLKSSQIQLESSLYVNNQRAH